MGLGVELLRWGRGLVRYPHRRPSARRIAEFFEAVLFQGISHRKYKDYLQFGPLNYNQLVFAHNSIAAFE